MRHRKEKLGTQWSTFFARMKPWRSRSGSAHSAPKRYEVLILRQAAGSLAMKERLRLETSRWRRGRRRTEEYPASRLAAGRARSPNSSDSSTRSLFPSPTRFQTTSHRSQCTFNNAREGTGLRREVALKDRLIFVQKSIFARNER